MAIYTSNAALPGYDQALSMVLTYAPALREEVVPLSRALGRVLRRDVAADRDQPPFDRSAMDGFAVRSADIRSETKLKIDGVIPAGGARESFQTALPTGAARRIATGAPLPVGADAVIQVELAEEESDGEVSFRVGQIPPWNNVHRRSVDASSGQVVLHKGTRLGARHIGIAAAVGHVNLFVSQQPRVTIMTTGDEIVDPSTPTDELQPQQVRNSNGPMLAAFLQALGIEPVLVFHLPDEPEQTLAAAREAASRSHLVLTNGGVSAGERDYIPAAWKHLGFETVLHGVSIQPGRPVFVAQDPCKLVLGLPGNPVSVLCTAHLLVWPVLLEMSGVAPSGLPWRMATLNHDVKATSKRQVFRAAKIDSDGSATIINWHGSGDLVHTAGADGFVRLPLQDELVTRGTPVPFLPMVGG